MAVCTTTLPAVNADVCAPNIHFGQIDALLFTRFGDSLTDVTDDTEWATRFSNSTALPSPGTDAPIRCLFVIGGIGEPEVTTVNISLGREVDSDPKTRFTLQVDDTGATNSTAFATLSGKSGTYAVWFLVDGQIFGGNDGIKATLKFKNRLIPDSSTAIQTFPVEVIFEGALPAPVDGSHVYTVVGADV